MKWFNNLKLSVKLVSGFTLIALISGIVGYIGISHIREIETHGIEMYQKVVLPTAQLRLITDAFQESRTNALRAIIEQDPQKRAAGIENVNDRLDEIESLEKEFGKTISSAQEKSAFAEFANNQSKYRQAVQGMLQLARQNQSVRALAMLNSEVDQAKTAEQAALQRLAELKNADAKTLSDENAASANSSVNNMLMAILAAIAVSIGLGIFIARLIGRPVNKLAQAAEQLASGDVNVELKSDSTDEIGLLASAFISMAENIREQVAAAEGIAAGNLNVEVRVKSDKDVLSKSINEIAAALKSLVAESGMLTRAAIEGQLAARGNSEEFAGGYREIIEGLNNTMDAVVGPFNIAAEYIDRISKGDIPAKITDKYNGDFNEIINNLNQCIDGLQGLVEANNILQRMAVNDYRNSVEGHYMGIYAEVAEATNSVKDRITNAIHLANSVASGEFAEDLEGIKKIGKRCEYDTFLPAFVEMMEAIQALVADTNMLSQAAVAGRLDFRADAARHRGDYQKVIAGVNDTLDAVVMPLNVAAEYIDRISKGDIPAKITDKYNGDFNEIINNLNQCIDGLQGLVEANNILQRMAVNDYRNGVEGHYVGIYAEVAEATNAVKARITNAIRIAHNIAEGQYTEDLEGLKKIGKRCEYDTFIPAFVEMMEAIHALVADTNMLSQAAVAGRLDVRTDAARHRGDYQKVIAGVNDTLDAVVGPFNVAAEYIDRISKGDIPAKITDKYNGDFNEIINNLNQCIDGLQGLVEANNILQRMAVNDYRNSVEGHYVGIYAEVAEATNAVKARITNAIRIAHNIAEGQYTEDLEGLKKVGKRCEYDTFIPAFVEMMEAIQALVADTNMLSQAAVAGQLDIRANLDKHQGDYQKVIAGVNETLDAVVGPIKESSAVLQEVAKGNLNVKVTGIYQGDHAEMKNALNFTIANIAGYIEEISATLTELSNGNLDVGINNEYMGDFVEIKTSLNKIIGSFNEVLGNINIASEQVASGSRQVSDSSQALSQGSTEQASSIEQLTSSMSEIAEQTKLNAVNANQANELAIVAKNNAVKGNEQMQEMLKSMEEINLSSGNIAKIIKVVDEIAFQTNILALNAAVEAARAGQMGKGFAVVADEVRNLAARSASAAKETATMIEGSIKKVEDGTRIANETADALVQIVEGITESANLVKDIAAASNDQASSIVQVNQGINQVAQVTQINSATAEESAAASEELSGQAEHLQRMVSKFKLKKAAGIGIYEQPAGEWSNQSESRAVQMEINQGMAQAAAASSMAKSRISLSDTEFDKY